jgi:hypothetical protein
MTTGKLIYPADAVNRLKEHRLKEHPLRREMKQYGLTTPPTYPHNREIETDV